ncbi:uncharacterized protein LOC113386144 [Ctenocephalides felis]|uniref:uncharacterized protein LOC113386144 n=1 Tax=Ctenocephalides felis TaxID=7515 RepID=UPI000E6E1151|nr:uncharacterized protein LOC113386144 [Ctenocephalides felis]
MIYIIDSASIIQEVRNHPCIWDTTNIHYQNERVCAYAWRQIVYKIMPRIPPEDHRRIFCSVKRRWRKMVNSFIKYRSRRKLELLDHNSNVYQHYDLLSFLNKIIINNPDNKRIFTYSGTKPKYSESLIDSDCEIIDSSDDEKESVKTNGIKHEPVDNNENGPAQTDTDICADDSAFFSSLKPILKEFTKDQKDLFTSKVLDVAKSLQSTGGVNETNGELVNEMLDINRSN